MAKNPTKGFTMDQLEKSSKKAEKQMKKSAAILPQVEGPGNPDYESEDPQRFAGDDTYTYKKKDDKEMYKNSALLPQINQGDYDYESEDEQEFPGDDRFTYEKKNSSR